MLQGIVIIYFLVINLVLFSMMGYDKNKQNVELAYSRTPLIDDRTCRWRSRWANGTKEISS